MSSHSEVICACTSINIDSNLMNGARTECDGLDLNTTDSFKVFEPGETCEKIKNSVKNQVCFGFTRVTSINAAKAYTITGSKTTWAEYLCNSSWY